MSFNGMWLIVSSPDFADDYLHMDGQAYVHLRQVGNSVTGEYHVGLQNGHIDGTVDGPASFSFSFEGNDEMEEMHGSGSGEIADDELTLELSYFEGDEYAFECIRLKE